jgi:hypothetical protein
MQTYSHFLLTLALYRLFGQRWNDESSSSYCRCCCCLTLPTPPRVRFSAVLLGSVLPDLPLIIITIVCIVADGVRRKNSDNNDNSMEDDSSWTSQLFSTWYFESPWVKAAHNTFHSPIILGPMMAMAYWGSKRNATTTTTSCLSPSRSAWCFWTLAACLLHTSCDVPVHHDDGPLILFPINWEYRFHSPLSYWDPEYHGREFAIAEHIMDVSIIIWECCRCCGGGFVDDHNTRQESYESVAVAATATSSLADGEERPDLELATLVD